MATLDKLKDIAKSIQTKTKYRPTLAIICGSGLGGLADTVTDKFVIPYSGIEGFPVSTVHGHAGNLVFGHLGNKDVVLMQGRFHPYEGYSTQTCTIPVRVLHLMGVKALIVTNAAGGLNPAYKVGDMMIIKDHINFPGLCGMNPLVGHNEESLGERFVPLSDAYDKEYRALAKKVAQSIGEGKRIHEGVYAMQLGPAFESIAECQMMKMVGGDTCGMSTTHEVIVARHMGLKIFGLSLVTNECIMSYDSEQKANHKEVLEVAVQRAAVLQKFIFTLVQEMNVPM